MADSALTRKDLEELLNAQTQTILGDVDTRLENLAGMVQRGFLSTDERLAKVEERLAEHDRQLESVTAILERIELRLSHMAYDIDVKELQERVERLEEHAGLKK